MNRFPLYPLLLGLAPLLSTWSANRAQQPAYVLIPALAAALLYLLLIYALAALLLGERHNAALAAALTGLVSLAYGHFAALLPLPAALLLLAAALAWVAARRPARPGLSRLLDTAAAVPILLALIPAAGHYLFAARPAAAAPAPLSAPSRDPAAPQRDVYWILVDNYSRSDVLSRRFQYDNSALVGALEQRGFVFPRCAQSNYPGTVLVVASTLNMTYLDTLGLPLQEFWVESRYRFLTAHIRDSAVMRQFKAYGYRTVTYRGFSELIDIPNADRYIDAEQNLPLTRRAETRNFTALVYSGTLFHALAPTVSPSAPIPVTGEQPDERYLQTYRQNSYALDQLERLPTEMPGPKFVYAHLYAAHWPYMHNVDGSLRLPLSRMEDPAAYRAGVGYLDRRLPAVIDAILAAPGPDPVIIVQSDHGNTWEGDNRWAGRDRLKILSAYYLPAGGADLLRDEISPVNNFRLVFKHYFGAELELLPDIPYAIDPAGQQVAPAPRSCLPAE